MRRTLGSTTLLVSLVAGIASAQGNSPTKKPAAPVQAGAAKTVAWADLVGEWVGKSTRGTSDSVITEATTIITADKKISIKFPNREPIAARLISMAGDSAIVEYGPYESITRKGHKVTTRMISHYIGGKSTGTFTAKFDDGATLTGKSTATRKK
jgi:hypothetical protein